MNTNKSIKQEFEEVQSLILENQLLQEKYPNRKMELELGLNSLKELESEMFEALKQEKLSQKHEIYEIRLEGKLISNGSMSMKEYGEFLINSQEAITIFAEDRPLSLNQSPSQDIRNITEMEVYAQCSGSLRILLVSKQSKLDSDENDNPVSNAFKKIDKISKYTGDSSDLAKQNGIGKRQLSTYKKLMKTLSSKNLNFEVKKPVKNKNDELICKIDAKNSYKMYKLINENPESIEEVKRITGILKAVDLEKLSFKIESKYGDETKIIRCDFNKNLEQFMISHLNNEITVELKNITEDFVDKNLNKSYEFVKVIN